MHCKCKHGGSRKKLTWCEKLATAQKHVVVEFLATTSCGCSCNCISTINELGEKGVEMVQDLRNARLAGAWPSKKKNDRSSLTVIDFSLSLTRVQIIASTIASFPTPGGCEKKLANLIFCCRFCAGNCPLKKKHSSAPYRRTWWRNGMGIW